MINAINSTNIMHRNLMNKIVEVRCIFHPGGNYAHNASFFTLFQGCPSLRNTACHSPVTICRSTVVSDLNDYRENGDGSNYQKGR